MGYTKYFNSESEFTAYSEFEYPFLGYIADTGETVIATKEGNFSRFNSLPHVCKGGSIDPINDSTLNAKSYGVMWYDDEVFYDPNNLYQLGDNYNNLEIHESLKRVAYNVNTKEVRALDENNIDPATITSDEDVMVEVPAFYGRSWKWADADGRTVNVVRISTQALDDTWQAIPHCYISAWPTTGGARTQVAILDDSTSTYDKTYHTNVSLADARTYLTDNQVILYYDLYKWILYWLPVIEFKTFATTREYAWDKTNSVWTTDIVEGVTVTPVEGTTNVYTISGSMGMGLVNHPSGSTNVTPPGATLCLGNRTGKVVLSETGHDVVPGPVCAYSWRGFENACGDIYTWLDGFITADDMRVYCANSVETLKLPLLDESDAPILANIKAAEKSFEIPGICYAPFMLVNNFPLTTSLALGETGEIIMSGSIGVPMDGFANAITEQGDAIGMSDIQMIIPGALSGSPLACFVGSYGHAARAGRANVASFGPGFLAAFGFGLGVSDSYVGFRTVVF